jgi:hypothetical protein
MTLLAAENRFFGPRNAPLAVPFFVVLGQFSAKMAAFALPTRMRLPLPQLILGRAGASQIHRWLISIDEFGESNQHC